MQEAKSFIQINTAKRKYKTSQTRKYKNILGTHNLNNKY